MKELKTSLLREKFVLFDQGKEDKHSANAVIALSNRMVVDLKNPEGDIETFTVRAHNMHSCIRICAKIVDAFDVGGGLLDRYDRERWQELCEVTQNIYEETYNPDHWVCIYNEGKPLYSKGQRHPFLDIIEKCDHENDADYEMAIPLAEDMVSQTGKNIAIDYHSNVALAVHLDETGGRTGIILRAPERTATFTFSTAPKENRSFRYGQCLSAAAAFLEGIQLAFMVGYNEVYMTEERIDKRSSDMAKQTRAARKRVDSLSVNITNFENGFTVNYRPERPYFHDIIESIIDR